MPKGKMLDVVCTDSGNIIPFLVSSLGWDVHGIDNRLYKFQHPNFHFQRGDIREKHYTDAFFDCVCAVSSIEHIGLKGRYNVIEDDLEGDVKAVREIAKILKPNGAFILTLPFGVKRLVRPLERVYDSAAVDNLLTGWQRRDERYYVQDGGAWNPTSREAAQKEDYLKGGRAIALFVLTPPAETRRAK